MKFELNAVNACYSSDIFLIHMQLDLSCFTDNIMFTYIV